MFWRSARSSRTGHLKGSLNVPQLGGGWSALGTAWEGDGPREGTEHRSHLRPLHDFP